jgi:hypothetical protein
MKASARDAVDNMLGFAPAYTPSGCESTESGRISKFGESTIEGLPLTRLYRSADTDRASIWTTSTMDGLPVTRFYQCILLLAGFMATFQTMGTIQSYGVFQVSPLVVSLQQSLHELLIFRTGILYVQGKQYRRRSWAVLHGLARWHDRGRPYVGGEHFCLPTPLKYM